MYFEQGNVRVRFTFLGEHSGSFGRREVWGWEQGWNGVEGWSRGIHWETVEVIQVGSAEVQTRAEGSRMEAAQAEHIDLSVPLDRKAQGPGRDSESRMAYGLGWGSMRVVATAFLSRIYYNVSQKPVVIDRVFKDWRPGGVISCKNCGEVSAGAMAVSANL